MLQNAPTDDQAEVLVYESIPVSMIKGIVFENEKIARQKIVEWKVMGFLKSMCLFHQNYLMYQQVEK